MFVLKLIAIYEAKDFWYGRRPFVMCARTGQFQKIRHLYVVFFQKFPLFWVRGSREGTRRDETIIYFHFSRFLAGRPQISSGTHPKPPQNLAGTTHLPRTSLGTSLEPLQNVSKPTPNRLQTNPRPIPNRPQTSPRPLLILGVVTLHDLN